MAWKIVRNWQALATVHSTRPDPYCIWAEVNGWLSYTKPDRLHPASVIIELERGEDFAAFLGCVANDIAVAPDYLGTLGTGAETFITASVTHDGLAELANPAPGRAGSYVKRFDLCDYIEPNRAPTTDEQMRRGNRCVPADTVTMPRARSSAPSESTLLSAPRALNEPVFCKSSAFSQTPPAASDWSAGVRTTRPRILSRAASTSITAGRRASQ